MLNEKLDLAPGVITGDTVQTVFAHAKAKSFAVPGVNVIGTNTVNAALETAVAVNSPVIIQFSNGGASFFAGKGLKNEGQQASDCRGRFGRSPHSSDGRVVWGAGNHPHRPCGQETAALGGWDAGRR